MNGDPTGLSIRSPETQDRRKPPSPPSELLLRHRRPGCERMESSAEEEAATAASCPSPLNDDTDRAGNRQTVDDDYSSKVDELEEMVKDVAQLFASAKQPSNLSPGIGGAKKQMDGCRKEFACTERMQELMRQFDTILKQISQHKWAWPFLEPVDVEGLGLHDYHELEAVLMNLKKLRERVILKCRKISAYEKRKLGMELSYLSPEDIERVLEIVAENNPSFQVTAPAVEIDLDAQSKITIWKLRVFVKKALECQASTVRKGDENLKRKRGICDALAKAAKKRNRDKNRSV